MKENKRHLCTAYGEYGIKKGETNEQIDAAICNLVIEDFVKKVSIIVNETVFKMYSMTTYDLFYERFKQVVMEDFYAESQKLGGDYYRISLAKRTQEIQNKLMNEANIDSKDAENMFGAGEFPFISVYIRKFNRNKNYVYFLYTIGR